MEKDKRYNFKEWHNKENNTQTKIPETVYTRSTTYKEKQAYGCNRLIFNMWCSLSYSLILKPEIYKRCGK